MARSSGLTAFKRLAARTMAVMRSTPFSARAVPTDEGVQVEKYWTEHNVTMHASFSDAARSIDYLHWRNSQYYGYAELMPTGMGDGLRILDFGCGPGNDLVGFGVMSKPSRLVGVDVSKRSLSEASNRLALHNIRAELLYASVEEVDLPFENAAFDLVHSSGVLHHMEKPERALQELRRVLRPGGRAQFMVYNRQSVWFHLYVPYVLQIKERKFQNLSLEEAFQRSTDGPDCPISRTYFKETFQSLVEKFGFKLVNYGCAIAAWEMDQLQKRHAAILDPKLPRESREFLTSLRFDDYALPVWNGYRAGINGCYLFEAV